jgi:hypothetical protein
MTLNVAIYHLSVPRKLSYEKTHMLQFFSEGVQQTGDLAINVRDHGVIDSDVAVIQGWVTDKVSSDHLKLRNAVITQQISRKRYVITADSNLFLYANTENPLHYLRYSANGVFPNTGTYFDNLVDSARWEQIQKDLNIQLKNYRTNGRHILICLQRNGGWSMGKTTVSSWVENTLATLRQHTNRPIVIRAHPGDRRAQTYLEPLHALCSRYNFSISKNKTLLEDLQDCWAVVNHNSSPAVAAAIEGYPVFVTDPERSQCREIANTDLSKIEQPNCPDRLAWVQRLAMSHWKFDELRSGLAWQHMRQFVHDRP